MIGSTFGKKIKTTIKGGSHEPFVAVDIEGLPRGTKIDMAALKKFLRRRAPGQNPFATKRKEDDDPIPQKGLSPVSALCGGKNDLTSASTDTHNTGSRYGGKNLCPEEMTDGTEANLLIAVADRISFKIENKNIRLEDYTEHLNIPRPGHADLTGPMRYGKSLNMSGGGPFSARMTAPLCVAGGIALQILGRMGVIVTGHILSIGNVKDLPFDPVLVSGKELEGEDKILPVISKEREAEMINAIKSASKNKDSLGGVVEVAAIDPPPGIGGAMYDGLESRLSPIFFGIPAVKGVEFGNGFAAARIKGSENNDAFYFADETVKTRTNRHGGILGGISTGMPLIARVAFKPTPSIAAEQESVDLREGNTTKIIVKGRHDPCVAVRAVPPVEAALALGLLDCIAESGIEIK